MRYLKSFETFDQNKKDVIDMTRKLSSNKVYKFVAKTASIIDDIVHFDFKALLHSFKNKSGFNKLEKMVNELGIFKSIHDNTLTFNDVKRYGIDAKCIVDGLNDPDVQKYFEHDKRIKKKFDELQPLIDYLKGYIEWESNSASLSDFR